MKGEKPTTDQDALRDYWGRWTAIVALFARQRPGRHKLDPCDYADLRRELIAVCRSLAQAGSADRRFYARLEEMVSPWLYLRVFESTDRELLAGLLVRCREVESKLSGGKSRPDRQSHWRAAIAIATVVGVGVIGGLAWLLLSMANLPVLYTVRDSADTIWLMIKGTENWMKGSVIAMIVVGVAMYLASRTARA